MVDLMEITKVRWMSFTQSVIYYIYISLFRYNKENVWFPYSKFVKYFNKELYLLFDLTWWRLLWNITRLCTSEIIFSMRFHHISTINGNNYTVEWMSFLKVKVKVIKLHLQCLSLLDMFCSNIKWFLSRFIFFFYEGFPGVTLCWHARKMPWEPVQIGSH